VSVLDFLRPAPHVEEIQDEGMVREKYKYWRYRTFVGMYMGYALYYLTRKSFTCAMPALKSDLGLDNFELGLLGTILSLSYGASKFLSGILGDKSNPRYFMSIGLILTGIFNILFGFSSAWWAFAIFWGLNGWFQGWGWPGCAKLLTHWYSHSERGRWWAAWNTSHNLGGAVIPYLAAGCAVMLGWRSAMFVPGGLCIAGGIFLIWCLRDTPQSLGLPPIEKFRNDYPNASKKEKEKEAFTAKEILWEYVLTNKYIWVLAFAYLFVGLIRTAVNDWTILYLVEEKHHSHVNASWCMSAFELGGFLGSLAAGWSSDLIFRGKRVPVIVLCSLAICCLLPAFQGFKTSWVLLDGAFLFLLGFFIFGPQMLIGMVPAELSHKKAAATATGFAGCFAYVGGALAGGPLGAMTKQWGWDIFFIVLMVSSVISLILMVPFWSLKSSPKSETCEES